VATRTRRSGRSPVLCCSGFRVAVRARPANSLPVQPLAVRSPMLTARPVLIRSAAAARIVRRVRMDCCCSSIDCGRCTCAVRGLRFVMMWFSYRWAEKGCGGKTVTDSGPAALAYARGDTSPLRAHWRRCAGPRVKSARGPTAPVRCCCRASLLVGCDDRPEHAHAALVEVTECPLVMGRHHSVTMRRVTRCDAVNRLVVRVRRCFRHVRVGVSPA
jgi:hypothetical protein